MLRHNLVKVIGIEDGRLLFEAHIRKGHEEDDIAKIAATQDRFEGKARFKIFFDESFSEKEIHSLLQAINEFNLFLNLFVRNENPVLYTNMELFQKTCTIKTTA